MVVTAMVAMATLTLRPPTNTSNSTLDMVLTTLDLLPVNPALDSATPQSLTTEPQLVLRSVVVLLKSLNTSDIWRNLSTLLMLLLQAAQDGVALQATVDMATVDMATVDMATAATVQLQFHIKCCS